MSTHVDSINENAVRYNNNSNKSGLRDLEVSLSKINEGFFEMALTVTKRLASTINVEKISGPEKGRFLLNSFDRKST